MPRVRHQSGVVELDHPASWRVEQNDDLQLIESASGSAITVSAFRLKGGEPFDEPFKLEFAASEVVGMRFNVQSRTWTGTAGNVMVVVSYLGDDDAQVDEEARGIVESLRAVGIRPVSEQFLRDVQRRLVKRFDTTVERVDGETLSVGPLEVYLGNAFARCETHPEEAEAELTRLVEVAYDTLYGPERAFSLALDGDALRPMLYDAAAARKEKLLAQPFARSLVVVYAVERDGKLRFVRRTEARASQLHPRALDNLSALEQPALAHTDDGLLTLEVVDSFTATRILLPQIRSAACDLLGAEVLAVVPTRDSLSFAPPEQAELLRAHASSRAQGASYRLSNAQFKVTRDHVTEAAPLSLWRRLLR